MRKALIGLILAATAIVPAAANAQRHHNDGVDGDSNGGEARAARSEARQESRQSQPQFRPQPQPQVQQQVVERQRGDGGNRGGWNRGGDNGGGDRQFRNRDGDGNRGGNGDGNRGGNGDGNRGGNGDGNRGGWNRGGDNGGQRGDWNRGGDDGNRDRRGRNNQPSIYPQTWQGSPNDPRLQHYRELERRNQNGGDYRRGDGDRRDWRNDRNDRDDNWRDGRRGDDRHRRGDWNRGWRNDNRYNWGSWRNQNRNRYHLSPYYSPYRNWRYQRFSIGLFLDSLFYDQRYWIGDPWEYRLPAAPYGTQWVRYYDDVILVDIYTGEVIDVIYDFFW